jgi:hypothetical protein
MCLHQTFQKEGEGGSFYRQGESAEDLLDHQKADYKKRSAFLREVNIIFNRH